MKHWHKLIPLQALASKYTIIGILLLSGISALYLINRNKTRIEDVNKTQIVKYKFNSNKRLLTS